MVTWYNVYIYNSHWVIFCVLRLNYGVYRYKKRICFLCNHRDLLLCLPTVELNLYIMFNEPSHLYEHSKSETWCQVVGPSCGISVKTTKTPIKYQRYQMILSFLSFSFRLIAQISLWTEVLVLHQASRQGQRPVWMFVLSLINWGRWEASSVCPQYLVAIISSLYRGSPFPRNPRAHSVYRLGAASPSPLRMCFYRQLLSLFR